MANLVIERSEEQVIRELKGWLLLYGRRKIGKTFLLRRVFPQSNYFMVTRSGHVLAERDGDVSVFNVEDAVKLICSLLDKGEIVVLDEFQRLSEEFWDEIALRHPNGRLIASGSSLGILKRIFDRRSPLLGLLTPLKLDLIRYSDAISAITEVCSSPRNALIWSMLIRDPWIIPMTSLERDPISEICDKAYYFMASASGLIGEAFEEEERALTRTYDALLRLTGEGVWRPSDMAGILASSKLIAGGQSTVTGLLERLVGMGLIEKIPLWKTRGARYYFKHRSPLLSIIYYLDQKQSISEGIYGKAEPNLALKAIGRELAFNLGEMLAELHNGVRAYTILPRGQGDIDIVILDRRSRKPIIGYEVKMGEMEISEAKRAIEKIHSEGIPKAGLISITAKPPETPGSHEELGPQDIIERAKKLRQHLKAFNRER
ncbi:MAG: ATP-binding protein [Thermoprotei archaeon]|nr:MAG: ATP-binding protein [Thermoprotei archaeon]